MVHQKETRMYMFVLLVVVHALTVERTIIHKINVDLMLDLNVINATVLLFFAVFLVPMRRVIIMFPMMLLTVLIWVHPTKFSFVTKTVALITVPMVCLRNAMTMRILVVKINIIFMVIQIQKVLK
jgi:hypothetical protein